MGFTSRAVGNDIDGFNLLKAAVSDAVSLCEKYNTPRFVGFLTEGERVYIEKLLKGKAFESSSGCCLYETRLHVAFKYTFFGGHASADRTLIGIFPSCFDNDDIFQNLSFGESIFPIVALTFSYRKIKKLSHRDFLGCLMALGVERDCVGDILCGADGDGYSVVFVKDNIAPYIATQLEKVGNEAVVISNGVLGELPSGFQMQKISGTVASLRLDVVTKLAISSSREEAARLIKAGVVNVNHILRENVSHQVLQNDVISVRGKGRFIVSEIGKNTRKGRIFLEIEKYI